MRLFFTDDEVTRIADELTVPQPGIKVFLPDPHRLTIVDAGMCRGSCFRQDDRTPFLVILFHQSCHEDRFRSRKAVLLLPGRPFIVPACRYDAGTAGGEQRGIPPCFVSCVDDELSFEREAPAAYRKPVLSLKEPYQDQGTGEHFIQRQFLKGHRRQGTLRCFDQSGNIRIAVVVEPVSSAHTTTGYCGIGIRGSKILS